MKVKLWILICIIICIDQKFSRKLVHRMNFLPAICWIVRGCDVTKIHQCNEGRENGVICTPFCFTKHLIDLMNISVFESRLANEKKTT